ncbi:hypothetical protein EDB85DRAFT_2158479 [Lactarius pseudohatsudake]|nr:hypothetical protein EDB85DRAFT_2158479 [Lactarius pseudohatsudake]
MDPNTSNNKRKNEQIPTTPRKRIKSLSPDVGSGLVIVTVAPSPPPPPPPEPANVVAAVPSPPPEAPCECLICVRGHSQC